LKRAAPSSLRLGAASWRLVARPWWKNASCSMVVDQLGCRWGSPVDKVSGLEGLVERLGLSFEIGDPAFTTSRVSPSSSDCARSACMLGLCPGKISRVNPAGPPLKLMRLSFDALVVWVADGAGCASWLHEAPVAFGEYYVLLRVLKNNLGSGDESCWKRGVCVTALTVWEVALRWRC
jgi:hypothetical protein